MSGSLGAARVVLAAVEDFNHGNASALRASPDDGEVGRGAGRPQALLGCSAGRLCTMARPLKLAAGSKLAVTSIRDVGTRRAICSMTTTDGAVLVGLYAVDGDRITAACHYFSDTDMLTDLGILPLTTRSLAHTTERLRRVIDALDLQVQTISEAHQAVPDPLAAALLEFRDELACLTAAA